MAEVGDRVAVASSKGGRREGRVTGVAGAMLTVLWDTGEESSLAPGPGVLRVVPGRRKSPTPAPVARPAATRSTSSAKKAPAKKAPAKKAPR